MINEHKVVTAESNGFTVFYTDSQKHYHYEYDQPLLPYLKKLQLFGDNYKGKKYQQFEADTFTPYQSRLYKDAVYGLNSYSIKQLQAMTTREKQEILRIHRLAQRVINKWKWQIVTGLVDSFMTKTFPRSNILHELVEATKGIMSTREVNTMSFAQLNLTKTDVANKLLQEGILPGNFFKAAA
jgi:hypothetical protein